MEQETRPSLLEKLRDAANHEAWAEFYALYGGMIRGYARRLGCTPAVADEVTQETLVRLLKRLPGFVYAPSNGHPFRSYLLRIAHGCAVDALRREGRFAALDETPWHAAVPEDSPALTTRTSSGPADEGDAAWVESVLAEAWRRVCTRIRPETARAFRALAGGTPPALVAQSLGMKRNALDQRKFQVIGLLRREVQAILTGAGETGMLPALAAAVGRTPWDSGGVPPLAVLSNDSPPPDGPCAHMRHVRDLLDPCVRPARPGTYLGDATSAKPIPWTAVEPGLVAGSDPDAGLRLCHHGVSGRHACFERAGPELWRVVDLDSTNGTVVDGRRVTSAPLRDGSVVQMGKAIVVFMRWE